MFEEQNKFNGLETVFMKEEISRCEDIEDLKNMVFPKIRSQQEEWSHKVNEIIKEKGFTKTKFADLCGVSRVSVDKWCKGSVPKNRETFLRIGMAAGYSLEKMNQLLQRYGQYPALYSKSLEDCVCIYVITHDYGEETIETYEFGANIIAPTAEKENYTFKHWSLTENGDEVTPETVMGTENLKYYAVFEADTYTVTWVIDGEETSEELVVGADIIAPTAEKENYTFKYWSLTENGDEVTPETVMGTENLKYYAVFEEIVAALPIKLVPVDGETGVVERIIDDEQFIESYNDGYTVTEEAYDNPEEDYEQYYVYGFSGRSFYEEDVYDYFEVQGNGYMELEYSELSDEYGTGAKIIVKDNDTDEIVEEFYVIIFGDTNGDAIIDTSDSAEIAQELVTRTWSSNRRGVKYRIKAADLDLSEEIDTNDSAALKSRLAGTSRIDQTTGTVESR